MEARKRARKYGVPFNLIADDVLIPKICPVLGIPIVLGNGKPTDHSPTVDRVVPKLGYIKSNIRVISYKANRIKSNATSSEVRRIFEYMQAPDPSFHSLISEDYRKQQEALHAVGDYGTVGGQYAVVVAQIIERLNVTHLLDYGCGSNCSLSKALKVPHKLTYQAYDPGVPRYAKPALPAQMVACIDVLEHVEPQYLDAVLDDICRLTEGVAFLSVDTGPAMKTLSDGRNAHLTQEDMRWWLPKIWKRFDLQTVQSTSEHSFFVIALAKPHLEDTSGAPIT